MLLNYNHMLIKKIKENILFLKSLLKMRKKLFLLFLITPLLVISWAKIDYSEFENPRKNFNNEKLLIELVSYFMQR